MNKKIVSHYKKKITEDRGDDSLDIKTDRGLLIGRKKNNILYLFLGVIGGLLLIVLLFGAWLNFAKAPASDSKDFKYFEVKKGEGARQIAKRLKSENLVKSDLAFYIQSKIDSNQTIKMGYYKLSENLSVDEVLKKFYDGEVDGFSITIPEGFRVLQVAKLLEEKAGIDSQKFIDSATGTEGMLFPDTYVFPRNFDTSKMVKEMKDNFDKRTEKLKPNYDQIIMASIVEREAKNDNERMKIAAVYKNRLDANMLLQADPTIRYALDSQEYLSKKSVNFTFWKGIAKSDYQNVQSSFNTYKNRGLPPAPICNPGLKSMEAVLNPEKNFDAIYFFHDKNQEIHFSKTYDEHLRAIQQFGL